MWVPQIYHQVAMTHVVCISPVVASNTIPTSLTVPLSDSHTSLTVPLFKKLLKSGNDNCFDHKSSCCDWRNEELWSKQVACLLNFLIFTCSNCFYCCETHADNHIIIKFDETSTVEYNPWLQTDHPLKGNLLACQGV